jgi:hypothetical protein
MGLTGNDVDVARSGLSIRSSEEVITHGEVLRVVPQGSHRVAIVIPHHYANAKPKFARRSGVCSLPSKFWKPVEQTGMVGPLFKRVIRRRIAEQQSRTVETERFSRVRIAGYQAGG